MNKLESYPRIQPPDVTLCPKISAPLGDSQLKSVLRHFISALETKRLELIDIFRTHSNGLPLSLEQIMQHLHRKNKNFSSPFPEVYDSLDIFFSSSFAHS
jgi:hypothetical protein